MSSEQAGRTEALRALEQEIGVLLRRIRRVIGERAVLVHPELGTTAYFVLGALCEGPRRASELSEQFQLDKGAVSRLVHQMIELGLVERQPDPADGRASILRATPSAVERMGEVAELRRHQLSEKLAEWGPGELDQLVSSLARYNAALTASMPLDEGPARPPC